MSRAIEQVKAWWAAEYTRHILWLAPCFAAGIALYFHLLVEPPSWLFPLGALLGVSLAVGLRRWVLPVWLALSLIMMGASWAMVFTHAHSPVVLREGLSPRPVIGVVRDIERTEHGVRLLLNHVTVDDLPAELTPTQIRLSVRMKKDADFVLPQVGDAISIRAGLMPPMGPALPGGFDFARYFSFAEIGAVGYGLPPWQVVASAPSAGLANRFWTWRTQLTDDIVRTLGAETGGIAAGLITGDARAISNADFNALRASNLYHIIAISGEHMVVIAGVIFVSLRLMLLLFPARLSLRPEGKSIIAAVTLVLVTVYLYVTGLPTSAVRAYVMIALVLLAVIFRRQVDPLRSLAVTAFLMLIYDPTCLLDPGFQLSFAATLALIALVEARLMQRLPDIERGPIRRGLHLLMTMILASVVAEAATAPLVISMFNNVSPYGVFANSLATPLVSLFLMPMVAVFFILLPFGLTHIALKLMHVGIVGLLTIARWVASFPHAQLFAPSLPGYGIALFVIGLLWVCLWQTRARRLGFIPAMVGILSVLTVQPPDMLVGGSLKQIAFDTPGGYVLARGRAASMLPELWANGLGYKELPKADQPYWRCDALGCVAQVKGQHVAFPNDAAALAQDCTHAQIIISNLASGHCGQNTTILDPKRLAGSSVTALWMREDGSLRVETSADWQGERPWSVAPVEEADGD